MPEIGDFIVGGRYNHETEGMCTVLINDAKHSVFDYRGYLLVKYENAVAGWFAHDGHCLIPRGYDNLFGENGLQWVRVRELDFENTDGYEVDE